MYSCREMLITENVNTVQQHMHDAWFSLFNDFIFVCVKQIIFEKVH